MLKISFAGRLDMVLFGNEFNRIEHRGGQDFDANCANCREFGKEAQDLTCASGLLPFTSSVRSDMFIEAYEKSPKLRQVRHVIF